MHQPFAPKNVALGIVNFPLGSFNPVEFTYEFMNTLDMKKFMDEFSKSEIIFSLLLTFLIIAGAIRY